MTKISTHKTKISKGSRKLLIENMNAAIANSPLPELRQNLINIYTVMLLDLGIYNGFGCIEWANGGYSKWIEAGKPDNTTPFLGDQTMIAFN